MINRLIALALVLVTVSCAAVIDPKVAARHVLAVDPEGRPCQYECDEPLTASQFESLVSGMLQAADVASDDRHLTSTGPCADLRHHHVPDERRRIRKLLIHVHGGMNTRRSSLGTAADVIPVLEKEQGGDWNYPIFLSWKSGPLGSYLEHALLLRNGEHYYFWGPISSIPFVATDLLRGVAGTLRTWFYELSTDARVGAKVIELPFPEWKRADLIGDYLEATADQQGDSEFDAALGDFRRGPFGRTWLITRWIVTLPLKLLVTPIFLDGMGQPAWDVMQHRAINTLHLSDETEWDGYNTNSRTLPAVLGGDARGGFAQFLRLLETHIRDDENSGFCYELTVVGHSMGAIIWNDALRLFPGLPVKDVVYMGAACSVADAERALVPYLQQHPTTQFYNLTLHPIAEAEEVNLYELPSRGSLLEWIDNWYSRPTNVGLKRLGKWLIAVQTLYVFRNVRHQVHLKGFGRRPGSKPSAHGEFNDCPFWRRAFWDPKGPMYF